MPEIRAWLSFTAIDGSSAPSGPRFRIDTEPDAAPPIAERAADVILTPAAARRLAGNLLAGADEVEKRAGRS